MKNIFNVIAGLFKTDPNKIGEDGFTRLQRAIYNDDRKKVDALLKAGADINLRGDLIYPPLHYALFKDRHDIAELLIDLGADVNLRDAEGRVPLHISAQQSQEYLMKLLLKANADPNVKNLEGKAPIHVIATAKPDMVDILVKAKARIDEKDRDGNTALHLFIRKLPMVEALLKSGASPMAKNRKDISPFQIVLEDDSLLKDGYLLRILINAGANIEEKNVSGETLLHRAARLDLPDIFNRIFDRSDLTAKDTLDNNVLHALVRNRNLELIGKVLERDASLLHERNSHGRTPMMRMMERYREAHYITFSHDSYIKAATMMIMAGDDVNTTDSKGQTLLHYAVEQNRQSFVEFLIAAKADLNIRDAYNKAPLNYAVERKNIELLDRLLDAGADPDLPDDRGWTVLDRLAEKNDRDSPVVQRLIVAGGQYKKMLPLNPDQMRKKDGPGRQKRPGLG